MMRGDQVESYISDAHPHEILETEKTVLGNILNQDSIQGAIDASLIQNNTGDNIEEGQSKPTLGQLLQRNSDLQPIPPIKSFVRIEGKQPLQLSKSNKNKTEVVAVTTSEQNTSSMLQQTPSEQVTNGAMEPIIEEEPIVGSQNKIVKVSQFTD